MRRYEKAQEYERLANELLEIGGEKRTRLHSYCRRAGIAIKDMLISIGGDDWEPTGNCPYDGICLPLNKTRSVVVNLVEALMEDLDDSNSEMLVFSRLEDTDDGTEV